MTTQYLTSDLMMDEGLRKWAYLDTTGNWTIGYGHKDNSLNASVEWSASMCAVTLLHDIDRTQQELSRALPWWRTLSDVRQDVLVNMAFNLGVEKLQTFTTFLELVRSGQYAQAGEDMKTTLWAKQVHARATRLAEQMETGVRQ